METTEQENTGSVDVNVYDDVTNFDLGEEVEKLKAENQALGDHIDSLEEDIEKLTRTIIQLKITQDTLTKNISSLYLTAKTEIERKDRMIAELRAEIDNVCFRRRKVDVEHKRKEPENISSESNVSKKFKSNRFDDKNQERQRSVPRYSPDRCNTNINSIRSRSRSREELDNEVDDRGQESDAREILDRYWGCRERTVDDRDRGDDERERNLIDWEKRTYDKYKSTSETQRYAYRSRSRNRERVDTYWSDRRWKPNNRNDNYRDDAERRFEDRDWGYSERNRRMEDWEKRTDDRYRWNNEMHRYINKNYHYRDSRRERTPVEFLERSNHPRQDSPLRGEEITEESKQKSWKENKMRDQSNNRERYEKFEDIHTPTPQTSDAQNEMEEKAVSKEQKEKDEHSRITPQIPATDHKIEENNSKQLNLKEESKSKELNLNKLEAVKPEDIPKNKSVKKRLKMLDVVEEKVKKMRSTPVKLSSSSFANQTENLLNKSIKSKNLLSDMESKCPISDRIAKDSRQLWGKSTKYDKNCKLTGSTDKAASAEKQGLIVKERKKSVSQYSRIRTMTNSSEESSASDKRYRIPRKSVNSEALKTDFKQKQLPKTTLEQDSAKDNLKGVGDSKVNSKGAEEHSSAIFLKNDSKKHVFEKLPSKYSSKQKKKGDITTDVDNSVAEVEDITSKRREDTSGVKGHRNQEKANNKCFDKDVRRDSLVQEGTSSGIVRDSKEGKKDEPCENDKEGMTLKEDTNESGGKNENKHKEADKLFDKENKAREELEDNTNSGNSKNKENRLSKNIDVEERNKEGIVRDGNNTVVGNSKEKNEDKQTGKEKELKVGLEDDAVFLIEDSNSIEKGIDKRFDKEDRTESVAREDTKKEEGNKGLEREDIRIVTSKESVEYKHKETDKLFDKENKAKEGLEENTNADNSKNKEKQLCKNIDVVERRKVDVPGDARYTVAGNSKEKNEDTQTGKEKELKVGLKNDAVILIEDSNSREIEIDKLVHESGAQKDTKKEEDSKGLEREDIRIGTSKERMDLIDKTYKVETKEKVSKKGKEYGSSEKEDTRKIKSAESVDLVDGNCKSECMGEVSKKDKEENQSGKKDARKVKSKENVNYIDGAGKSEAAEDGNDEKGKESEKEDTRKVKSKESANYVADHKIEEKVRKLFEDEGNKEIQQDLDIKELKKYDKKTVEEPKRNEVINQSESIDSIGGQPIGETKKVVTSKKTDDNITGDYKNDKTDKLSESKENGKIELKINLNSSLNRCESEEKKTGEQSKKTDRQSEDTDNKFREECNDKNKQPEEKEESMKNEEKESDKQSNKEVRRKVDLREDDSNMISHYKNEGTKAGKMRINHPSSSDLDPKAVERNEKNVGDTKETGNDVKKSSTEDEPNVAKTDSKPVKNLLGDKTGTENVTKSVKSSAAICTRRRSSRELVKEQPQDIKNVVDKDLEKKLLVTQKDVQKNPKVRFEVGSKNKTSTVAVKLPISSKTKEEIKDKRKISGDSKTLNTKKKEPIKQLQSNIRATPKRNAGSNSPKLNKNVNKAKTGSGPTLRSNKDNKGSKEVTKMEKEEEKKAVELNNAAEHSEPNSVMVVSEEVDSAGASSTKTNNEQTKRGIEHSIIKKQVLKKRKSQGKSAEPKVLDLADTWEALKDDKPEKKIHIIDCRVIVQEKRNQDLLEMAMEGILDSDESKIETSATINPKSDVPTKHSVEAMPIHTPTNENGTDRGGNKETKSPELPRKKIKIDSISKCPQRKAEVHNQGKTKQPTTATSNKPTKQLPKIVHETLTSNSNSNKDTTNKSTQNSTPDKTVRRRITPTPVSDHKPICSFENILEKTNQPAPFTSLPDVSPLHLTHEGEIPVLHLEENQINCLPTETNINDRNILSLLDTMNISNIECELPKFKSANSETASDSNLNVSPIKGNSNLTFENVVRKVTSTPIVPSSEIQCKGSGIKTASDNQISVIEGVTNGLAANIVMNVQSTVQTLTSSVRRRRRCRLVIKD